MKEIPWVTSLQYLVQLAASSSLRGPCQFSFSNSRSFLSSSSVESSASTIKMVGFLTFWSLPTHEPLKPSHHYTDESQISNSIQTDIHIVYCTLDISAVDPNSARAKQNLLPTLCPRNLTAETRKHSLLYLDSLSVNGLGVHPSAQAKTPGIIFTTSSCAPQG